MDDLPPKPENKYTAWLKNVQDDLRPYSDDEIREILKQRALPYAVLMSQLEYDGNIGTVIRNANFMGSERVLYYSDRKQINRKAALGCYQYTPVEHVDYNQVIDLQREYTFVALEQDESSIPLHTFDWTSTPKKPLILLGEETLGLPYALLVLATVKLEIPTLGSVRSLNVGCASAIAMNYAMTQLQAKREMEKQNGRQLLAA